ncbi:MAG: stage II sporulation protein R [Clostridia bacterium]|nr:stage II sporulation protein R [Clostridia bacterium]
MKNKFILSIILGLLITFGTIIVSESAIEDISSGIIRLHIIANSNEAIDQNLKLKVRDRILKDFKLCDLEEIDLEQIKEICEDEIKKNGFDYDARVVFGKYYFPTKSYENITLPAGNYNAVRILIGKAEGENWWCVMYPPLCFNTAANGDLDETELNILKQSMKQDNYELIENNEIKIKPAFKIVELWQKIKHRN